MKSILTLILATFLLIPLQAQEKVYTVDNLPKVHLQNKMQYVCNPAGILSQAACDTIDTMLHALEQQTGIETVVAIVPSIGDMECFDFCHQLLNQWGVGKKGKDNGLVILLVTDQRCIQFYTGYGLEGVLPDAICKRIQTKYMIPYLKDGNWNEGMVAGIRATCQRLDGSMENESLSESNNESMDFIRCYPVRCNRCRDSVLCRKKSEPLPQMRETCPAKNRKQTCITCQWGKDGRCHLYLQELRKYNHTSSAKLR